MTLAPVASRALRQAVRVEGDRDRREQAPRDPA
jgi:hypothetical protein